MKNTISALVLLFATLGAHAQNVPQMGGKWVGSCSLVGANQTRALSALSPLLLQTRQYTELEIEQNPDLLDGRVLRVRGQEVVVGGIHSDSFSLPIGKDGMLSFNFSSGATWDLPGQALTIQGSGLLQLGNIYAAVEMTDVLSLKSQGRLNRNVTVSTAGKAATIECSYQRL